MIRLREMSLEEQQMIERLAHSCTAEARIVERARMVRHACQDLSASIPLVLRGCTICPVRRFESWEQACQAVEAATAYWNKHRHPFKWGPRRRRFEPSGTTGSRCGSLASQWRQKLHELAG